MHPDGYEKSQFYFHLAQNLKVQKKPTSALPHDPGKELFVDFAGDTLGYVNVETGELIKVQTFVSTMACTDYAFALCVPSQKTEDFIPALGKALEFYGYLFWTIPVQCSGDTRSLFCEECRASFINGIQ